MEAAQAVLEAITRSNEKKHDVSELENNILVSLSMDPTRFLYDKVQEYEKQLEFLNKYLDDSEQKLISVSRRNWFEKTKTGNIWRKLSLRDSISKAEYKKISGSILRTNLALASYSMLESLFIAEGAALRRVKDKVEKGLSEASREKLDYCITLNDQLCKGYFTLLDNLANISGHYKDISKLYQ